MTGRGRGFGGGRRKKRNTEHQKQRRHDSQARSRATLDGLFDELHTVVCPTPAETPAKTPAKWKILDHARGFLKEKEAHLSRLLALKRIFLADEDGPCNLDEFREEYRTLSAQRSLDHSRRQGHKCPGREGEESSVEESAEEEEEAKDESVQSQSSISPQILEFEGLDHSRRQGHKCPGREGEESSVEESAEEEEEAKDESVQSQSSISPLPTILEFEGLDHSRRQGHKCPGREGEESSVEESAEEEEEAKDESVQSQSSISPQILEFEGYLLFYRQSMDMLVRSGVLSQRQTGLAVVSEAISAQWDRLSPECQASYKTPPPPPLPQSTQAWAGPAQTPPPDPDTHLSQGDTASSPSFTFPEDLLQDDLVMQDMDSASEHSSLPEALQGVDFDKLREIERDITEHVKTQMSEKPEHTQDPCLAADYEEIFLRCSESLDSEDF